MFKVNLSRNVLLIVLMLLPMVGIELTTSQPILAQAQGASRPEKFDGFFAPKGKGMPDQSQGGASRGMCFGDTLNHDHNESGLISLITPQTNSGLSAAARPMFLAHIPPSTAKQVYFSLKNGDESYFYEQTVTLTSSGILKFQLPEEAPALEVGEQYRWSVALICGTRLSPDSPWASGLIERIDGGALLQKAMTPMEQASAYGRAGLWYDTIASLFTMVEIQSSPTAKAALNQLLVTEGLSPVSLAVESLAVGELTDEASAVTGVVQP